MTELSVVVPVYGCRDCLRALHERLVAALEPVVGELEIVLVDDRSTDGAWELMRELAAEDPRLRLVRLSRNFGQHAAITAGIAEARGRWIAVTDCDLEDPPEEIPRLYRKAQEGYEIVLSRRKRRRQALWRRIGARAYRWLANALAGTDVDPSFTNMSVISRRVADAFLGFRDQERQYLLILLWLGFEHITLDVEQDPRHAGHSSYSMRQLLKVAADGIFFQTTRLLRWIIYAGFVVAVLGVLLAALVAYNYITREPPAGWTSLAVLVLILSGFVLVSLGVTGLYVGKIFGQVKGRPLYVVDERIGDGEPAPVPPAAEPQPLRVEPEADLPPPDRVASG